MTHSVGIVGGVGPGATSWAYLELFKRVTQQHSAGYPLVHIYSLPLRVELVEAFVHGAATRADEQELIAGTITAVRVLRDQGVGMVLIPCNTIHLYLHEVRRQADGIAVANMPYLASKRIRSGVRTLILGTSTSCGRSLYGPESAGLSDSGVVYPDYGQQCAIDSLIDDCIQNPNLSPWPALKDIIGPPGVKYDDVLLACTDLCTFSPPAGGVRIINSLSELVDFAVKYVCESKNLVKDGVGSAEPKGHFR